MPEQKKETACIDGWGDLENWLEKVRWRDEPPKEAFRFPWPWLPIRTCTANPIKTLKLEKKYATFSAELKGMFVCSVLCIAAGVTLALVLGSGPYLSIAGGGLFLYAVLSLIQIVQWKKHKGALRAERKRIRNKNRAVFVGAYLQERCETVREHALGAYSYTLRGQRKKLQSTLQRSDKVLPPKSNSYRQAPDVEPVMLQQARQLIETSVEKFDRQIAHAEEEIAWCEQQIPCLQGLFHDLDVLDLASKMYGFVEPGSIFIKEHEIFKIIKEIEKRLVDIDIEPPLYSERDIEEEPRQEVEAPPSGPRRLAG